MTIDLHTTQPRVVPPRSILFGVPLEGTCGSTLEALSSYLCRLSALHQLSLARFVSDVVNPQLVEGESKYVASSVVFASAPGRIADSFVRILNSLTLKNNLELGTFLPWRQHIGLHLQTVRHVRYCPLCLVEQKARAAVSYALIWTLPFVRVCHLHGTHLLDRCYKCGTQMDVRLGRSSEGRCYRCGCFLRDGLPAARTETDIQDRLIARSVHEMLSLNDSPLAISSLLSFPVRMQQLVAQHFAGNELRASRELGISRDVLRSAKPRLSNLIEVASRFGVTPVELLSQSRDARPQLRLPVSKGRCKPNGILRGTDLDAMLTSTVQRSLQREGQYVFTRDVASALSVSYSTAQKHLRPWRQRIKAHNTRASALIKRTKAEREKQSIYLAMRNLHLVGGPFTPMSIRNSLKHLKISFNREKEALTIARLALSSLLASENDDVESHSAQSTA